MNLAVMTRPDQWKSGALILPVFSDIPAPDELGRHAPLAWLKESAAFADVSGSDGELTLCHAPEARKNPRAREVGRVLCVGLGESREFTMEAFRGATAKAVRFLRERSISTPAVLLAHYEWLAARVRRDPAGMLEECVLAVLLAAYSYDAFRSQEARKKNGFTFESLGILADKRVPALYRAALARAEATASGVIFARDLANGPANCVTPSYIAEEAVKLAKRYGFSCRVLDRADMKKLGMGALLAVAKGSAEEPRFIVLEHAPRSKRPRDPIVLAGKGITFDSGGISLKPAAGMERMKRDMSGAAAVLGVFECIGRNPDAVTHRVVGLLPCAENMPGGHATRPGDVVAAMNGVTIEIVNTDAEGRLILADALAYAQKEWNPAAIVDIATLTGACVVALGNAASGLFCDDAPLREKLLELAEKEGETCWHMPLWDSLAEGLKSEVADTMNSGHREGAAITAALFLRLFVERPVPWAHIDMAGAGYNAKPGTTGPAGATGYGVRLLYGLVRDWGRKS